MKFNLLAMTALSGVFMVACGNSTTDTSSSGGGDTGGGGTGGNGVTVGNGGSTNSAGGGTPDCYDESAALKAYGDTATVGQNVCSSTVVADFFTACLDMGADMTTCGAWEDANADCETCIFGADATAPTGNSPVLLQTDMSVYLNSYACEAAALGLPQCALPASQLIFCAQTACGACEADADFSSCIDYSIGADGICADIEVPTECEPVLNADMLDPKCDGADFEGAYNNIANYFCGPAL